MPAGHLSNPLYAKPVSPAAEHWATRLGLTLTAQPPTQGIYLLHDAQGLALGHADLPRAHPVRVDFLSGELAHRRQFGGGRGQAVAKACGLKPGVSPQILDATLGLATDAFVLASLGCRLLGIERHPWVAALVQDGLQRAAAQAELDWLPVRLQLLVGDSSKAMAALAGDFEPEVVYLDPMFPPAEKTAEVRKEMRFFRELVGADLDADALLQQALDLASHRVVVKRPRKAAWLAGRKPGFSLTGKANRFDVYTLRKLQRSC